MLQITPPRVFVALLTLFGFAYVAYLAGAPVGADILAVIGGIMGTLAIVWRTPEDTETDSETVSSTSLSSVLQQNEDIEQKDSLGISIDDLMTAIDDPCLLVGGRRVEKANPAAIALLGDHIIDEDIRLAIRHPAAAERLVGDNVSRNSRTAIELVGIGERERPWELVIHELSDGNRFVRLADRSSARSAEKMRVDFVANASHELRTPLASIIGYIETLQGVAFSEKKTRKRFLKIMFSEATRMQSLINDLMSLSRIEAEKFQAPNTEVKLKPVIEDACESACMTLGVDQDRVKILSVGKPVPIRGDRVQIEQLVSNLVGNALKYAGPKATVTVRYAEMSALMMRIIVEDNGEGIPADHLPRLTERFYRADPGRSRSMGGTGLGLAIVKHIVERHRGKLSIESVEGEGTKVTVDLPKNPPAMSSPRNENVTEGVEDGVAI